MTVEDRLKATDEMIRETAHVNIRESIAALESSGDG